MDTHRPNQTRRSRSENHDHRSTSRPGPDALTVIAQGVESLQPDGAPPAWVEIIGPAANATSQTRWHQGLDSLIGFVAPPDCDAIVTVGYGWAHNTGTDNDAAAPLLAPGERHRCRVVLLMTRTAELAGYLRTGTEILIDEPPTSGRIPDLIRRSFGLPTPPPEENTTGLLAGLWLYDAINAAAPLSWAELAAHHPAMQVAAQADIPVTAEDLERLLRVAAEAWSWSQLVRQATQPGWLSQLLPPGAGGWMDEGILSRWVLSTLTPLDTLVDRIMPRLTPTARNRLQAVLAMSGASRPTGG
jgi:hypothetical protein